MGDAYISQQNGSWQFIYGKVERKFATRDEAVSWAESFSDETGQSFLLHIEKA